MEDSNAKVNEAKETLNKIVLDLKDFAEGTREAQIKNLIESMLYDDAFTMDQDDFNDRYSSDEYYSSQC